MCASYDRNKTHKIQRLLDRELDIDLNNSWGTRHADRVITLDDQTTFHLRSFPGELRISVDKRENQDGSFDRIKDVCEDIKEALGKN